MSRSRHLILALVILTCSACSATSEPSSLITEAEYKMAVSKAGDCMRRAGFQVSDAKLEPNGWRWSFSLGGPAGGATEEERVRFEDSMAAAYFSCSAEHLDEVERSYRLQRVVPSEERQAVMKEFVECVADAGDTSMAESDSRETIDQKLGRIVDPAVRAGVETCMGRFAGLWPETIS